MMLRFFKGLPRRNDDPHAERGAVIVFFLFVFFAIFVIAALAIDAGNLYHARIQLQKAADAGVLGGIGRTILDRAHAEEAIEERAIEVTCDNLHTAGIKVNCDAALGDIKAEYDDDSEILVVTVAADIDFLLMDAVPFFLVGLGPAGSKTTLQAVASGRRMEANIALLLDVSFSMDCPSIRKAEAQNVEPTCHCQRPERTGTCQEEATAYGVRRKVEDLKTAVGSFLEHFDENRDRIMMVPYNISANVAVPLKAKESAAGKAARGFDKQAFIDEIDKLQAQSNTNICDAMFQAYNEFVAKGITPREEVAYVIFSDGAPTAGRFLLANPLSTTGFASPSSLGAYDYMHFGIEYVVVGGSYTGPSVLVKQGGVPFGYDFTTPIVGANVPSCSASYTPPTTLPPDTGVFDSVFTGCVNNLGFHMPNDTSRTYGSSYASPYGFSWREQYYNCAVQTADFLRSQKSTLYTIGLGMPSCVAAGDPYQDIADTLSRKDVLLTRIAADLTRASTIRKKYTNINQWDGGGYACSPGDENKPHPDFLFGNQTYAQLGAAGSSRSGTYLYSVESRDLEELFKSIAILIRLRLLQ